MTTADLIADMFVHRAHVSTLTREGEWGDSFADPVWVDCFIDHSRTLVRDGAGAEVVSEATLTTHPHHAALFTPGSLVDLGSRTATVIKCAQAVGHHLDLPDHCEVVLT